MLVELFFIFHLEALDESVYLRYTIYINIKQRQWRPVFAKERKFRTLV